MILIALTSQIKYSDSKDVFTTCILKICQDFFKYSNQYGGGLATKISLTASDR